jgi:hypothetical protein
MSDIDGQKIILHLTCNEKLLSNATSTSPITDRLQSFCDVALLIYKTYIFVNKLWSINY